MIQECNKHAFECNTLLAFLYAHTFLLKGAAARLVRALLVEAALSLGKTGGANLFGYAGRGEV